MNKSNNTEKLILGTCYLLTFGKNKGKTVYDLANEGNFKYLRWLLDVATGKRKVDFSINPTMIPHIKAALKSEYDQPNWIPICLNDKLPIQIHFQDDLNNNTGPIVYRPTCVNCEYKIFVNKSDYIPGQKYYCYKCIQNEKIQIVIK